MSSLVLRPHYDSLLKKYQDSQQIKVLTGVRRCGKSTLLEMIYKRLLDQGTPNQNVVSIRFDSSDVPLNPTVDWLNEQVVNAIRQSNPSYKTYFLLDEIQEISEWEKVVRRLYTEDRADVYITGSNSFMLSSDLATYLSGRYIEIPVFPLSFREYVDFYNELSRQPHDETIYKDELFNRYLRYGGMPSLFSLADFASDTVLRELNAIHDTVILNDVAKRFEIRDIALLEKLVRYLFSTSGNLFSTRSIIGALQSAGRKVYAETIESYIDALQRAFLIYPCEQEGLQGKNILRPLRKMYAPDTGLRNLETEFKAVDIGFQLESVVRMELARRGFNVTVGTLKNGEIDFVGSVEDSRMYIQVSRSVSDESVFTREIKPLRAIKDSFPKLILTTDRIGTGITDDGIQILNLIDWLLDDK